MYNLYCCKHDASNSAQSLVFYSYKTAIEQGAPVHAQEKTGVYVQSADASHLELFLDAFVGAIDVLDVCIKHSIFGAL